MVTREAVKAKVGSEAQEEPRMICQEVEDELNIIETCLGAVEGMETEEKTTTHMPVTCAFQKAFWRLQELWQEIMKNPDVLHGDR